MTTEAVRRALQASGVRPLRVSGITLLGSGYASDAYLVRTTDGDRVLRLAKAPFDRTTAILRREVRLLRALERHDLGIAIPRRARTITEGRTLLGTIHDYVPGTRLRSGLRGARRAEVCADLGRFLAALHAVPPDVAERAGVANVDLWEDTYRALIEQTLPQLPPGARAWLTRTAQTFAQRGTRRAPRVLVHGDIQANNLLTDVRDRLTGIIDFGNAMICDPALDFAGVLNQMTWPDLERVWAAYRAAGGRLDADVERRVRFYIAVVPIYRVLYGEAAEGPAERLTGIRQLVARAAAATRRGASPAR